MKYLYFIFFATFIVKTYAQENWQILNPKPSPETGIDVKFINNNHGFILTTNHVLETNDSGENWSVNTSLDKNISMDFEGNYGAVVYGEMSHFVKVTTDQGQDWVDLNVPLGNYHKVKVFDDGTIYLISTAKIHITNDLGETWIEKQLPNYLQGSFKKVQFLDKEIAVFFHNGVVYKTIDSGDSWIAISPSDVTSGSAIFFLNENLGWFYRGGDKINRTINGGLTWDEIQFGNDPLHENIRSIYFSNETHGYMVGDNGNVYKTSDGGITWNQDSSVNFTTYSKVYFKNFNDGIIIGNYGAIHRTSDAGNTWSKNFYTLSFLNSVYLFNSIGYSVSSNKNLYKTSNGGNNWVELNIPEGISLFNVIFINENVGILYGNYSDIINTYKLYKTTDGGNSWTQINNGQIMYNIVEINFINEQVGFIKNNSNTIKTTDGGNTFHEVGPALNKIHFINENVGFGYSSHIYKTTDSGNTWNIVSPINYGNTSMFKFINENIGYKSEVHPNEHGNYYSTSKTENGGNTWTIIEYSHEYSNSYFYQEGSAFIKKNGKIYHSTDDMENLTTVFSHDFSLNSVHQHNGNFTFYGFYGGTIVKTIIPELSTFEQNASKISSVIYPNPTTGVFHIKSTDNQSVNNIEIFDMAGKYLDNYKSINNEYNIGNLSSGIYIVKIFYNNNSTSSRKLIVTK